MKPTRLIAVVGTALTLSAAPAQAQICGGNNFSTCASVSVQANYNNGIYTILLSIQNFAGMAGTLASTVFTQIGLIGLPVGASIVANSFSVAGGGASHTWTFSNSPNGLNGSGITGIVIGVDAGGNNGLTVADGLTTFGFQIAGMNAGYTFNDWAVHGQALGQPTSCSTKLVVNDGTANQPTSIAACATVTPEPASMALLATGLAGLAGGGFVRRRWRKASVS